MSYAGPDSRTRDGRAASRPDAESSAPGGPQPRTPTGQFTGRSALSRSALVSRSQLDGVDADGGMDWAHVAIFGTGLLLGVAVGAGAALLAAPRSGAETRAALAATVGRARRTTSRRTRDAWDDLRDELRNARRQLRRRQMHRTLELEAEVE